MWYIYIYIKHLYYIYYIIIILYFKFIFEIGVRCAIWNPWYQQQSWWNILRTFLCFLRCMGRAKGRALPWTSKEFGKGGTCMACFVWKNWPKKPYLQCYYLHASLVLTCMFVVCSTHAHMTCLLFVQPMHIWHVCCLFDPMHIWWMKSVTQKKKKNNKTKNASHPTI